MRLRTRLMIVVAGLGASFIAALIGLEVQSTRASVREEIEASNTVASLFLGRIAAIYSAQGGPEKVQLFLEQLGRVRANDVYLRLRGGGPELYHSPAPTYKAGREAPRWFARLLTPREVAHVFPLTGGAELVVEAQSSRAILDAWDDITWLFGVAVAALVLVCGVAFLVVERALKPFPIIAAGLANIERGEFSFRLPVFTDPEAEAIGAAFNRMAQGVQDKARAEREARAAEASLEARRELTALTEQRVEEERRLIAHELHDEFGQSVTAIRSLAVAIAQRTAQRDAQAAEMAQLIADEAARLYDAMHGLIPRLAPLSLDTLGLADTLEGLVRDWRRRNPATTISLRHELPAELGSSVTLTVYRVVQEGLINALRHAHAAHVDIDVSHDAAKIIATVRDDGVGLASDWQRPGHFGLRGLTDRVAALGGVFTAGAVPGGGTQLTADIPK